jgi:hypothetical protein
MARSDLADLAGSTGFPHARRHRRFILGVLTRSFVLVVSARSRYERP